MALDVGTLLATAKINDALSGGLDRIADKLTGFGGVFGVVTKGATVAGVAVGAATAAVVLLAKRGDEVGDVAGQFDVLAQSAGGADAVLTAMREGTSGLINDFDLMQSANRAFGAGLQASAEDMGVIAAGAKLLAERVGGDASTAFDTLTSAMAKGQVKALTGLSLTIEADRAYKAFADSVNKSSGDLTDHEKKLAIQQATVRALKGELAAAGEQSLGFADRIDQITIRMQNFVDRLAVAVDQSPVLAELLNGIGDAFDVAFGTSSSDKVETVIKLINEGAIVLVRIGQVGVSVAKVLNLAWDGLKTIFLAFGTVLGTIILGFGKLAEGALTIASKVPGMGSKFDDAAEAVKKWNDVTKNSITELGQRTASAGKDFLYGSDTLNNLADSLAETRTKMEAARHVTVDATKTNEAFRQGVRGTGDEVVDQAKHLEEFTKQLHKLDAEASAAANNHQLELWAKANSGTLKKLAADAGSYGQQITENLKKALGAAIFADFTEQVRRDVEDLNKEIGDRAGEAVQRQQEALREGIRITEDAERNASDLMRRRTMSDYQYQVDLIRREEREKVAQLSRLKQATTENLAIVARETEEKMIAARIAHDEQIELMKLSVRSWGDVFTDALGSLPGLLQKAFTGGGGVGGALKAAVSGLGSDVANQFLGFGGKFDVGNKLAQKIFGSGFGQKIGGMASQAIGTALGAAIPVIGAFAGPLLEKAWGGLKKLFGGISEAEKQGRAAKAAFQDSFGTFENMVAQIDKVYAATGKGSEMARRDIQRMMEAEKKGAEAVQAVVADIQKEFAKVDEAIKRNGLTWRDFADSIRRSEGFKTEIGGLVDEFNILQRAGYSVDAIMSKMGPRFIESLRAARDTGVLDDWLNDLVRMGKLSEEAADKLRRGLSNAVDFEELERRAEKYGITLQQLGPKFQQANVSRGAKEILKDFNDLVGAGGEINGVMIGMSDEMSTLVQRARKFGSSLPTEMKPVLETFLNAGQLVDENGKKLDSLSGITFADSPLEKGLQDLNQTIIDLILTLGGVPTALQNIGKTKVPTVRIPYRYERQGDGPGEVEIPAPEPPPEGGAQLRPGGDGPEIARQHGSPGTAFESWGSGTPITVHGDEAVITRDQGASLADMLMSAIARARSMPDVTHINLTFHIQAWGPQDMMEAVRMDGGVADLVITEIERNKRERGDHLVEAMPVGRRKL